MDLELDMKGMLVKLVVDKQLELGMDDLHMALLLVPLLVVLLKP